MSLGYDGKLYILAFDHRGSFQKKMFGIEGDPTPEETAKIADAKHLIFEGMAQGRRPRAWTPPRPARSWTSSSAATSRPRPRSAGSSSRCRSRRAGRTSSTSSTTTTSAQHILDFDPDFSKVLVRYNPDGDTEMNARQNERLKRLADWLHENDRKFLYELLVPAEDAPARAGGRRHRPLRRRAAP